MANYTSKNNVEAYLGVDFPATLDDYIAKYLNAVDLWIDNYLGTSFKDGGADITKYYDCYGGKEVYIDTFEGNPTEVTTLDTDGDDDQTLTENDDYYTYPLNKTSKNKLILIEGNNRIGVFPNGKKRLKVTANFGLATIPADIELAATQLVASILKQYISGGETKSETVGDTSFTYKDIDEKAKQMGIYLILNQYRIIPLGL